MQMTNKMKRIIKYRTSSILADWIDANDQ